MTAAEHGVTVRQARTGEPIVVLHSLQPPDGTTKYVDHMVDGAAPGVHLRFFSFKSAYRGGYDVLHVHWPELLVRDRRPWRAFAKRRALDVLLVLLRLRRVPIVWTAHNPEPHETWSAAERTSVARFERRVALEIRLNDETPVSAGRAAVTIPHGHYRSRFEALPLPASEPGRLLYFGIIRPYKGVDALLRAFEALPGGDLTLRIVGDPHAGQRELVEAAEAADHRVSSVLRYVDDDELVDDVGRAALVVLPYQERMGNSGSLLVALSLGRPVLVPASPVNAALAAEVGPGWVHQYDGELTAEVLAAAVRTAARSGSGEPRLASRDLDEVGRQHAAAYERAITLVRR